MENIIKDLIGPAMVGLVSVLAVIMQVRSGAKNITKQINEQIDADREQRFWNIRLDSIIELHRVLTETTDTLVLGRIQEVNDRMYPIIMNISTLFKGEDFVVNCKDAFEILVEAKEGSPLPKDQYDKYGDLILTTIESGLEKLGAFE